MLPHHFTSVLVAVLSVFIAPFPASDQMTAETDNRIVDTIYSEQVPAHPSRTLARRASHEGVSTAGVTVPADMDARRLSSNPAAARTIYLDADGAHVTDPRWTERYNAGQPLRVGAFDLDGDTTTWSPDENTFLYVLWTYLTERFAAFEVNVTTQEPTSADLRREGAGDQTYGVTVGLTSLAEDIAQVCNCVGVGLQGSFGASQTGSQSPTHSQPRTAETFDAWVVYDRRFGAAAVADTAAHEVGHTLGLTHSSDDNTEYYSGEKWAPLMGQGRNDVAQWSDGGYAGATRGRDDLASIAASIPQVQDQEPSKPSTLAPQVGIDQTRSGIIGTASDIDAWALRLPRTTGPVVVSVESLFYTSLVPSVRVVDHRGRTISQAAARMDAGAESFSAVQVLVDPPTTAKKRSRAGLFILIDGIGVSDRHAGSISDYGSVGTYTIAVSPESR